MNFLRVDYQSHSVKKSESAKSCSFTAAEIFGRKAIAGLVLYWKGRKLLRLGESTTLVKDFSC